MSREKCETPSCPNPPRPRIGRSGPHPRFCAPCKAKLVSGSGHQHAPSPKTKAKGRLHAKKPPVPPKAWRTPCAGCGYGRDGRNDHEAECPVVYAHARAREVKGIVVERPHPAAPRPAEPAPIPLLEAPAAPDPKATIEQRLKAQIRDGHRGLELLRDGPGPWSCEKCGPLTRREEPMHGSDERMHCPRCDGPCTTGVAGELEETRDGTPWEHPGKKAARIAARGGNAP